MKFPYGLSNFNALITEGYYYCDRTGRVPVLEDAGKYLLFIRPRRFGKSLLLSMLSHYYDMANKDRFAELFGGLEIGRNPTPSASAYLVMSWDFSCVDPIGSVNDIRRALHNHVNACIYTFYRYYASLLPDEPKIDAGDAISSLKYMLADIRQTGLPLYLFIDEYDNFANEVMMEFRGGSDVYEKLVNKDGVLKTLFKAVKSASGSGGIDRIFITGVSPVVMSDMTSGFNIAENIYLRPKFNDLCGFTEEEMEDALQPVIAECGRSERDRKDTLALMRTFYNGYVFSPESDTRIYNPTLALYFLKRFQDGCRYPRNMLDTNLATDAAKLEYAARLLNGGQMLLDITREKEPPAVSDISDRFGIRDMLNEQGRHHGFIASYLYYFGVLTIAGERSDGTLELRVPNLVTRGLYVDNIAMLLLPNPSERDEGRFAANDLTSKGDMAPLCEFVEKNYFRVFSNRDYRWANELTVKTAFLTLLYNDILYIMDSERETGRGYPDLTMIIRPDMRRFQIFDILIEFKFVELGAAGISGEAAKNLPQEELTAMPAMISEMKDAREQLKRYGDKLEEKHGNLRLRRYAVVSLGFERIWWEEVRINISG